jgi:Na+/melibiose symporter-like transporter
MMCPATPENKIEATQHRQLFVLALPAFGLACAYTVVTTYTPVLLSRLSGPAITGALIAMEGLLALLVPPLVGGWSDRLRTRWGARLPFVATGAIAVMTSLVWLPSAAGSRVAVALALAVFFVAYFLYYAPYYALFPDLVATQAHGRSQGFQGALRSAGLLSGMAGGGILLSWWLPLPFLLAAGAIAATTVILAVNIRRRAAMTGQTVTGRDGSSGGGQTWRMIRHDRAIGMWALSNSCWEAAIAALRTFVVLYFTHGLGMSLAGSAGALALVGLAAIAAAPLAGILADRYGSRRVMRVAAWLFAVGLTPPLLTTNRAFIAAIVPVTFAAVVLMTLPYALLMDLLPPTRAHGAGASVLELSRGIGIIIGPCLAGIGIELTQSTPVLSLRATHGYAVIFAVSAVLLLAGIPFLTKTTRPGQRAPQ